jgi:tRNA dimethylallyltransferase
VPFIQVGLEWSRPALGERIASRVGQMMAHGFLEEVTALAETPMSRTARQALGYRELLEHLHGGPSLDETVATIITRTRQFAVRQIRWFRRDPRIRWVPIEHDPVAEALPVLEALS